MTIAEPVALPPLPARLTEIAVTEHSPDYRRLRSSYMKKGSPTFVLRARDEGDVVAAVDFAASVREEAGSGVPISIRSGGHGIAGTSTNDGGIIIDLRRLSRVTLLDPAAGIVQAQAGAIWGDVAGALASHDLLLTSGNFGDTGVGGLATAGGVGYFAREQGLTIDRVRSVRLLTADGRVRWVDADHEADLFWAVRGGGSRAGIALNVRFQAARAESTRGDAAVIEQEIHYVIDDLPGFTERWARWIASAPTRMESFLTIQRAGEGRAVVRARNIWAGDDVGAARPTLQDALRLGPVHAQDAAVRPYPEVVPTPRSTHVGQQQILMRNALVNQVDSTLGAAMTEALAHPLTILVELRALGGAVAAMPDGATAWGARHHEALVATWIRPGTEAEVDTSFAPLQVVGSGEYEAYSSDRRASAEERAFPGEVGTRLRAIAAAVDPHGLFARG